MTEPRTGRAAPIPPAADDRVGRLLELAVADLALIERARIELDGGFNVLTGETGAGKSLVIDALGLALGARADTSLVRHGAESARVEALFDRVPEPLICVRTVAASGRSTARVDDETVTAAALAELVGPLVEIHGQHDQQRLLDERRQRQLLDAFGDLGDAVAEVGVAVAAWRANRGALDELRIEPRELARRLELLEHEVAEIASARLRPGEADEITARLAAARHGESITRGGAAIRDSLVGEGSGARDAAAVARTLAESADHDPAELARLEERLSAIYGLERRYGDDEAAVVAHGERAAAEVERLQGLEGERARRETDDAALLQAVAERSERLSRRRAGVATALGSAVESALAALGFRQTRFEVVVGRRPAGPDEPAVEIDGDAVAFDAAGIDEVVFRFAPNPGEPARPLARVASGGELSRVALAIKEVLAAADATPTLVFDEVDSGIGGRSADPVGRSLWTLARRHQVLVVTHLPHIAAYADAHFQISKRERDGRTVTEVRRLTGDERIVELAHMLGGEAGGPASLAGARELLARAERWRGGLAASA